MTAAEFIASLEGFKAFPYLDSKGVPTFGFGFTQWQGKPVTLKTPQISKDDALKHLEALVSSTELKVRQLVAIRINEGQAAALTALAYNIGLANFSASSVLKLINGGAARDQIEPHWNEWNKIKVPSSAGPTYKVVPGLVNRRAAEVALYFSEGNNSQPDAAE